MKSPATSGMPGMLFIIMMTVAFLFNAYSFAQAQEIKTDYKVGDRVECHLWGKYYKGTVVSVSRENWQYRVKFDFTSETTDLELACIVKQMRPLRESDEKRDEVITAPKAEPTKAETPKVDKKAAASEPEDLTRLADREPIECPVAQEPVAPDARPDPELLKKVIRCLYERRAPAGMDGAKTVDISEFKIGKARKWRPRDDIGSGTLDTVVYPVKVTMTEKTFYRTYTKQVESTSIFNCYVNAFGEWECGLGQRLKEGEIQRLPPLSK